MLDLLNVQIHFFFEAKECFVSYSSFFGQLFTCLLDLNCSHLAYSSDKLCIYQLNYSATFCWLNGFVAKASNCFMAESNHLVSSHAEMHILIISFDDQLCFRDFDCLNSLNFP